VRHYDASGLIETVRRDFHGNMLEAKRRLNNQPRESVLDWQTNPQSLLETESFAQLTEFDALNRPTRVFNWHRQAPGSLVARSEPRYNKRGLLRSEQLTLRLEKGSAGIVAGASTRTTMPIEEILYDEKGQKICVELGNGTATQYDYDPKTFRLRQLRTTRPADRQNFPGRRSNLADPNIVQQLLYTYDPAGNITEIVDEAYEPVFFQNQQVEARSRYEYDPLYRLISATGRENGALTGAPTNAEGNAFATQFPLQPADPNALRKYTQTYQYDRAGNLQRIHHDAGLGSWTRRFRCAPNNNRLVATWNTDDDWATVAATAVTSYDFDSHGNVLNLADTAAQFNLRWDHRDTVASINLGGGGIAYYQYDADRQRTRKRIEDQTSSGSYWERIYFGRYELYRRYSSAGSSTPVEEIETHHVFEGEQRIVLVDDVVRTNRRHADGRAFATAPIFRYQYSNHLGSASLELDEAAGIISYEEFHPYGTSACRAVKSGIEAPLKRYRYTGMERDEESGLAVHGARMYSTSLARWLSSDPEGIADGLNLYEYCHGSPLAAVDPSGRGAADKKTSGQAANDLGERTHQSLKDLLDAQGIANRNPVYDADGNEITGQPGKRPPRPEGGIEIDLEKLEGPDVDSKGSGKKRIAKNYTKNKAGEIARQGLRHAAVTGKSQVALVVTYNKSERQQKRLRKELQQKVNRQVETLRKRLAKKDPAAAKAIADKHISVGVTSIDKVNKVTKNLNKKNPSGVAKKQGLPSPLSRQPSRRGGLAKATLGGLIATFVLVPLTASAASSVVPAGAAEATYEITSVVVDGAIQWVQQVGPQTATAVLSALFTAARLGVRSAVSSAMGSISTALTATIELGTAGTVAMGALTTALAAGAVYWAYEDTRRALAGQRTMTDEAVGYWGKRGFGGTLEDLWWQIKN
jgi:RHS repeat-associated protein